MKKAKIDTKARQISPHSFRHSLTTLPSDSGYSADKIMSSLGWSNDSTKERYVHVQADAFECSYLPLPFSTEDINRLYEMLPA